MLSERHGILAFREAVARRISIELRILLAGEGRGGVLLIGIMIADTCPLSFVSLQIPVKWWQIMVNCESKQA